MSLILILFLPQRYNFDELCITFFEHLYGPKQIKSTTPPPKKKQKFKKSINN